MDTKSTKNNYDRRRNIYTFVILAIALALSFVMIYRYHSVEVKVSEDKTNPFETRHYASDLFDSNYYLYFKSLQSEHNKLLSPSSVFLTKETIDLMIENMDVDYYSSEFDAEDIKLNFDEAFKVLSNFILDSSGNIKYYAYNKQSRVKTTNYSFNQEANIIVNYQKALKDVDGDKEKLDEKSEVVKEYKELENQIKKKFLNFVVIDYDKDGRHNIVYTSGLNKEVFNNFFLELEAKKNLDEIYKIDDITNYTFSSYRVEPIKNMIYIYAIPQSINTDFYSSVDTVSNYINKSERNSYKVIEELARYIFLTILLITFAIPISRIKMFRGISKLFVLPIELITVGMMYLHYSVLSNEIATKVVRETITGNMIKYMLSNDRSLAAAKQLVNVTNILYWFVSFVSVYIFASIIKMIIKNGVADYFKKRSLLIRLIKFIYQKILLGLYRYISVDLVLRYNRLFITGIAIIVFGTIILPWITYFGEGAWFISMFIYIAILIIYIRVVNREIKEGNEDYIELLGLTKDIAYGNLDTDIMKADVGLYEEIQMQLFSIQQAYKKSVEEEVKSQKAKSDLISNISHDLKTPLTSIITYVDLLNKMDISDDAKVYIDTISRKSERLKVLIDDMFEISKAQSGSIKLEINEIDLVRLMQQSIFEVSDRLNSRGITLITKFPENKVILSLDGEKTYRIFENLLVNIAKYSVSNSRAYVDILDNDKYVDVIFRNISEEVIDYEVEDILERFKRGDKSRNTEGSGLGLSIAKGYVEAQNGKLDIYLDGDLFKLVVRFNKNIEEKSK